MKTKGTKMKTKDTLSLIEGTGTDGRHSRARTLRAQVAEAVPKESPAFTRRIMMSGLTQEELEQEGSTLLAMLYAKAREDGLQTQELATEKLGVHPSYLGQLRIRNKYVENISHDFAEACARYLQIPLIAVLVAAGQLKEKDFREPVDDSVLLRSALEHILRDPAYGPIMPANLVQHDEKTQRAFVLLYEKATGKKLLGFRMNAGDLATFARSTPTPFKGNKRKTGDTE